MWCACCAPYYDSQGRVFAGAGVRIVVAGKWKRQMAGAGNDDDIACSAWYRTEVSNGEQRNEARNNPKSLSTSMVNGKK